MISDDLMYEIEMTMLINRNTTYIYIYTTMSTFGFCKSLVNKNLGVIKSQHKRQ